MHQTDAPLTKASTSSPSWKGRSPTMASAMDSTISRASFILRRLRPGSPWMPMPSSNSSSPRSKVGLPAAGTAQLVRAMPMLRTWALTFSQTALTSSRGAPSSARAPTIFSMSTVPPTPRRPAVYRESCTATSSFTTTWATGMPSAASMSAAIWKFITSPV